MSERGEPLPKVGVRELRQNLSVYLDRVKAGETLEVTEHGHPVAQLGPRPTQPMSALDRLIAEGRVRPATRDLLGIPSPVELPEGCPSLSETLLRMRAEERE
jgi:prevent-host-death family protein